MRPARGPGSSCASRSRCRVPKALRLVKGSHIVVRKLFEHDHAYIFQNPDKRIIFAIPYEGDFTLIGTTDVEHLGRPGDARIDDGEIALPVRRRRAATSRSRSCRPTWCGATAGVRPLLDDDAGDASAVTRDYLLELDDDAAPLLSVWGGKITTFRKLAEEAAERCSTRVRCGARRAARGPQGAFLPGGDLSAWIGAPRATRHRLRALRASARAAPSRAAAPRCAHRCARCYGARVERLLDGGSLGAEVAPGLYEAELRYLREHEWARTADDVLWRRTKLGLHLSAAERERVAAWWADATGARRGECDAADGRLHGTDARRHRAAGRRRDLSVPARPALAAARGDGAARRHAGRQDHADAADGRARRAEQGPRARRRPRRDRHAGARAQRRDGLPAVHQLPVDDGGRQHRVAAEAARRSTGRSRARARAGRQAAHRALPAAAAGRAVGRPAAARRAGARAGQGRRR